jgi:hypothetical protein
MQQSDEANSVAHIYVLMHGTWARNAAWCRDGSELRTTLVEAEAPAKVHFDEFEWTARNSSKARLAGASALRRRILELRAKFPGIPISLIAHSHAGNIAMLAMRDWAQADEISEVICLSTPFIHAAPRTLGRLAKPVVVSLSTVFAAPVAYYGVVAFLRFVVPKASYEEVQQNQIYYGSWGLAILIVTVLLFMTAATLFSAQLGALHERNRDIADSLRLPTSIPARTLLLRNVADEAGNTLGATQLLSQLMSVSLNVLHVVGMPVFMDKSDASAWPRRLLSVALWVLGLTVVLAIVSPFSKLAGFDFDDYAKAPLIVIPLGFLAVTLTTGVALLLIPVVVVAAGACMAAFGWSTALGAVSLHLSAEASPPGNWTVLQLSHEAVPLPGLNHATHSHPEALRAIAAWVRARPAAPRRP